MMRLRSLVCVVVLVSACDNAPPLIPGPTGPSPTAPPLPASVTVSGTVYEHGPFGQRPLPNAELLIWPGFREQPTPASDGDGRYTLTRPPIWEIRVRADFNGYRQPCFTGGPFLQDMTLDVHVVPETVLSTSGVPSTMPIVEPSISGRVVEQGTRLPVHGARVIAGTGDDFDSVDLAETLTDSTGRYVLCGLKSAIPIFVSAYANGYAWTGASITIGDSAAADFELEQLTPN